MLARLTTLVLEALSFVACASATAFGPGDFYMFAPGAVHYLWIDGPVEL